MFSFCFRLRRRCAEWTAQRRARCDRWRTEWRARCDRWRQVLTQRCDRWRTEQQQRCDRWRTTSEQRCDRWEEEQSRKCDGWGIFSFICVAWVTITTWVCKAYVTVVSTVCDLWVTVTSTVCDLWTTIVSTVCDLWTWVGSLVCDVWTFVTTFVCRVWETIVESICSIACFWSRLLAPTEYSKAMSECIYGWTARYRIEIDPRECVVRIVLRIRLAPGADVSATDIANVQALWEPAIEQAWTGAFPIELIEGRCPCRGMSVVVDVQWVTTGEHHVVNVLAGSGRADMANWYVNSTGGTAAHEAGHMFGNPDEYADANCPMRTVTSDGSIMQTSQRGSVKRRHYEGFATWVSRRSCCRYEVERGD
jgi:hypothetical protein